MSGVAILLISAWIISSGSHRRRKDRHQFERLLLINPDLMQEAGRNENCYTWFQPSLLPFSGDSSLTRKDVHNLLLGLMGMSRRQRAGGKLSQTEDQVFGLTVLRA